MIGEDVKSYGVLELNEDNRMLNFEEKPSIDGLLLSHAHADHADYMTLLRNDIPFYMSQNSKVILEVLDTTGTKEL